MDWESPNELCNERGECLPLKSIDELKMWKADNSAKHSVHPLQRRACTKDCPKTLVCHDMKGGYLEDRFANGSETEDNYFFIHWSLVDIFVYFSHHLVTIPPCGWITSGHRNGVKVLGTFITEHDEGKEICDAIFRDVQSVYQICLQLVSIATFYQFDGWLINIENKLKINQMPLLEKFVTFLTMKMHESQPHSLVIWYDSVIESGELKWQNELNEHNKIFFHVCDGIYLNYNWTKDTLSKSVKEAGCRRSDVFVGVDVFGRGCLGGGGFSTDIAVTAARDFNLSVAVFAPGWVYECLDKKDFMSNQYKFWHSLSELCASRVIESLPYYSSFCPGFGKKMYRDSRVIRNKPWYDLNLQQPQPSYHYTNCSSSKSVVSICSTDAFNGGGCLQLKAKCPKETCSMKFKILSTNFLINTGCSISYTYKTVKMLKCEVSLILSVDIGDKLYEVNLSSKFSEGLMMNMMGTSRGMKEGFHSYDEGSTPLLLNCLASDGKESRKTLKVSDDPDCIMSDNSKESTPSDSCRIQPNSVMLFHCNDFGNTEDPEDVDDTVDSEDSDCVEIPRPRSVQVCKLNQWVKRNYKLYCHADESFVIKNVSLEVMWESSMPFPQHVNLRLGELSISPIEPPKLVLSYKNLIVNVDDKSNVAIKCLLEWTSDVSFDYFDLYMSVHGFKSYICTTSQCFYKFEDSIKLADKIDFILRPNRFGEYSEPIFLKVPVNCDNSS